MDFGVKEIGSLRDLYVLFSITYQQVIWQEKKWMLGERKFVTA